MDAKDDFYDKMIELSSYKTQSRMWQKCFHVVLMWLFLLRTAIVILGRMFKLLWMPKMTLMIKW